LIGQAGFRAVDLNRDRLALPAWASAAMVKSAVVHHDSERVAEWARRYSSEAIPTNDLLWQQVSTGDRLLTLDELRWLSDDAAAWRQREGYVHVLDRFAKSAIAAGLADDRDLVHHWTSELSHVES
jgi:hypothetical protein